MSLRLQIKKKMLERSPRVKSLDFHPQNSWVLVGLYSGTLALHDYNTNTCIRTLQCSNDPIRTVKFIPVKHWMVAGSDDRMIRVYNYNTMEKVKGFQAHQDFLRAIIVHPLQPLMITCSDDRKIKIWNFDKDFLLVRTLSEHEHFVLGLAFNPRDLTKFASASMDRTIKIWNLTTEGKANLTLSGHKSGVNTIDFYKGDKPHLVSGSDDRTIKVWDYQTKQCLNTLQAHSLTVTSVFFHPQLPLLISTGEDGKVVIHHSNSFSILNVLQYNLERSWAGDVSKENSNILAFGYDEGTVVIKIGSDQPVVSLNNGKILWAKSLEVFGSNLKALDLTECPSGEKIKLSIKQLGTIQLYASYIKHSPNGHHFAICNQKQFAVIKAASFKTVVLGNGTSFVWHNDSDFAVLDVDKVNIYHNFQFASQIKVPFIPSKIFEGVMLGIAGPQKFLFYEWNRLNVAIHQLNMVINKLWWSESGSHLTLVGGQKMTIYKFNKSNLTLSQQLVVNDKIGSGVWVEQIFIYMTLSGKIYFTFSGKTFFYCNAQKKQFIFGSVEQQNRIYLFDRNNNVYSIHFQFQILKQIVSFIHGKIPDLPNIPVQLRDRVAKCLQAFNFLKQAYRIAENHDQKFQLALALGLVREAYKIAASAHSNDKVKIIGDICLKKGEIQLAIQCYNQINDLNSLLLIYSSLSLPQQLGELGVRAEKMTKMNVAYMCYFLTNNPEKCVDVLIRSKRYSQAALFSRTYCSKRVSQCVRLWRQSLVDKSLAQKISDPNDEDEEDQEEGGDEGEQVDENQENGDEQKA